MRRVIEPIDHRPIPARHQMPVDVAGDRDRLVAELFLHVRQALALLNEKRRKRVPQVVEPDASQLRLFQNA